MRFLRRIAGFLGFAKDDHDLRQEPDGQPEPATMPSRVRDTDLPRKAKVFGVDRAPILAPSTSGDGGVQGLRWYAKRLKIDEDGDVADEFLDEVSAQTSALTVDHKKTVATFKLKYATIPAKVMTQVLSDGKLQQCVEHQGRLQWV
ncbi:uncharacterized protein LOC133305297 [Gastrolobium bilobum]|uniref:uncharacterized protein LOC133305297 n=1 Tax=Gastrolobium bilobum TaxID=150636 RepID=UPI002AAFF9A1|nr:uncharacterized protein LOC133305297 [Gastrolobium bilobum]